MAPANPGLRAEKARTAVIDASSAILLAKVGLLAGLAENWPVVMSPSVLEEAARPGYPGAGEVTSLQSSGEIRVLAPMAEACPAPGLASLGRGECDTITAWMQGAADFVIIDDGRGAGFCRRRAVPYINALLVPRLLFFAARLTETACAQYMDAILSLGRYGPEIIRYARAAEAGDLRFFIPISKPRSGSATTGPAGPLPA